MDELRPILNNFRNIDPELNKELSDLARRILPETVGVKLADSIETGGEERLSVDTPAFKNWFGDSKILDKNGEPLVVYHGTFQDFDEFKYGFSAQGASGAVNREGLGGAGFYFSSSQDHAELIGISSPYYLSIKDPLRFDGVEELDEWRISSGILDENTGLPYETVKDFVKGYYGGDWYHALNVDDLLVSLSKKARKQGNDGVVLDLGKDSGLNDVIVAFEPTQIKSATGNRGTFDPNDPRIRYSLPGFKSPVLDAVQNFKQEKASPQQWKALLTPGKTAGVKQDELDWLGVQQWLDEQGKSVSKDELLDFIEMNKVELDEKILSDSVSSTDITVETKPVKLSEEDRNMGYSGALEAETPIGNYSILRFEDGFEITAPDGREFGATANTLDQAKHMIAGDLANISEGGGGSPKFDFYRVPGGDNYKEMLIRLPELSGRKPADALRREEISDRIFELTEIARNHPERRVPDEYMDEFNSLKKESDELDARKTTKYTSPHFNDQEVVHIRFDEREVDGKKTLFINEVQSDLHQQGRRFGYRTKEVEEGINKYTEDFETAKQSLRRFRDENDLLKSRRIVEKQITKLLKRTSFSKDTEAVLAVLTANKGKLDDISLNENFAAVIRDVEPKIKSRDDLRLLYNEASLSDEVNRVGRELKRYQNIIPDAPFKGDLWQQLALKRMIQYAVDNDFEAISWARGEQIAEAVGGDAEKLAVQYDKSIPKFLGKYTKKFGGKIRGVLIDELDPSGLSEKVGRAIDREKANSPDAMSPSGLMEDLYKAYDLISGVYNDKKGMQILKDSLKPETIKFIEDTASRKFANGVIDITPQMRQMAKEQPLFSIGRETGKAQGAFSPVENLIQISRAALNPEQTLKHEAIHALKHNGLFTDAEWKTLTESAKEFDWAGKHNIEARYGEVYGDATNAPSREDFMLEEAIADEFSQWVKGETTITDQVRKIFRKIQQFLQKVGLNLRKEGIQSFEDVFEKISSGQVASRGQSTVDEDSLTSIRDIVGLQMEGLQSEQGGIASRIQNIADEKGELSDEDIFNMFEMVRAGPPKEPETLTQFLHRQGGLVDFDGDLKNMGINSKSRPGFIRKKARSDMDPEGGLQLDEATRMAWDEGFLKGQERPEINDLLEALADDFNGIKPVVRAADEEAAQAIEMHRLIESELARFGVDPKNPRFAQGVKDSDVLRGINRRQDQLADERIAKMRQKMSDIEEAQRKNRIFTESSDDFDQELFDKELSDIADSIYNKLTGREDIEHFNEMIPVNRGPLKSKSFKIPDNQIDDFLEDDIELIGRRYSRVVSGQIELKRKFGSLHMKDHIQMITDDYNKARKLVSEDDSLTQAQKEAELNRLTKQEESDKTDIKFARDKLLGVYKHDVEVTNFRRAIDLALAFNYMRALGGVLITSFTDIWRPTMVHGMGRVFGRPGLGALVRGSKGAKMNRDMARKFAGIAEITNNSRIATMADLNDPHAAGSYTERFTQNMTSLFSRATGLPYWNQFLKEFSSTISMDRIIDNAMKGLENISATERKYMNSLGFGEDMVGHIVSSQPKKVGGVWVIDPENLNDAARRTFFAGVAKDVDIIIVTKGLGDAPMWTNHPVGRMIFQFKSFGMASHQRVLMRGLQNDKAAFISGLTGMITAGMFVYALKQLEAGREVSDNPGTWLAEGVDRSGVFSVFFELNNVAEKWGGPGVYSGLAAAFPEKSQKAPASRYAVRSDFGALFGPSFGLATDTASLLGIGLNSVNPLTDKETDLAPSDIKTMRRLLPFVALPYWRWFVDHEIVPYFQEQVE